MTTKANIVKKLKASVALTAVVAFIMGGLMLCCGLAVPSAQAAQATSVKVPPCHALKKEAKPLQKTDSKSCDCCKFKPASLDNVLKIVQVFPSLMNDFHYADIVYLFFDAAHLQTSRLAYTGPPPRRSSIPIYLQVSNLRL